MTEVNVKGWMREVSHWRIKGLPEEVNRGFINLGTTIKRCLGSNIRVIRLETKDGHTKYIVEVDN